MSRSLKILLIGLLDHVQPKFHKDSISNFE